MPCDFVEKGLKHRFLRDKFQEKLWNALLIKWVRFCSSFVSQFSHAFSHGFATCFATVFLSENLVDCS